MAVNISHEKETDGDFVGQRRHREGGGKRGQDNAKEMLCVIKSDEEGRERRSRHNTRSPIAKRERGQ